jgi:predicted anti-sigma-YlaC factor YlaD
MNHTFSRQQWVEYTCGVAPPKLQFAMDQHIRNCEDCRALARRFEAVDRELIAAVALIHDTVPPLEISAERAYQLCIRQPASGCLDDRIDRLQLFLTPICGFGTAQRAMFAAAARSAANSVELLTELEWPSFVSHLSSIVGTLCGEPTGRVLWHIGQA